MYGFDGVTGFEWDEHNSNKNYIKHNVSCAECEETFFEKPLLICDDEKHSKREKRIYLLGTTCSRETVRKIKSDDFKLGEKSTLAEPLWFYKVDWKKVEEDFIDNKHALKFIWEEQAQDLIGYSGFWKQFYKQFPKYKSKFVTHRFFSPGEYSEVDYAGGTVEYVSIQTGVVNIVNIFIGVLCHSHYLYAVAKPNMKSENFLDCHRLMYEHFQGVPLVTVPDCLKQGVSKCCRVEPLDNPFAEKVLPMSSE